ncbi:MAG TPA: hypothetical protein VFU98_10400 [Microlunatus sp.]|nr:hypothetical protein [Microlunatus sp.]
MGEPDVALGQAVGDPTVAVATVDARGAALLGVSASAGRSDLSTGRVTR